MKRFLLLGLLLAVLPVSAETLKWPEGEGRELVYQNCLICHSGEIIMGQRLSPGLWTKEVEKMAGWGSPIPEADKKVLIDYLSKHFSPETPVPEPERERFPSKRP